MTYRIDKRLTALLEQSARQNNTSINRELENVLLEHYKAKGLIETKFTPLGEMRGGDRRSKEARGETEEDDD